MQFNLVWSDGVTHLECRHQRVYNLGINPMPPMPLLLMLQLLHYLAAFLYLWFCQDWWGNCPAALTGLEINDFIEERQQKMYSGENKFSWVQTESEHETWNKTTSLARSGEITSPRIWFTDQYSDENTAGFYTEVIRGSRQREMKTLRCIQELCDLTDNIRKISSC